MKVEYAKLALERILEIAEFRFPDNAERARVWMGELIQHTVQLADFPKLGHRLISSDSAAGEDPGLRRLRFKDVWIIYEVRVADSLRDEEHRGDHVLVLTVRHVREKPGED